MNIHVPEEIRIKWCNYEFRGTPFELADGKRYIRAYSKTFEKIHFYSFEDDIFWHDRDSIPIIKKET